MLAKLLRINPIRIRKYRHKRNADVATLIGGKLEIEPASGAGTTIYARIPSQFDEKPKNKSVKTSIYETNRNALTICHEPYVFETC